MNKTPTTLIIMDGFGLRTETEGNAVAAAATPRLEQFFQEFAHTELSASGLDVGLPGDLYCLYGFLLRCVAEFYQSL